MFTIKNQIFFPLLQTINRTDDINLFRFITNLIFETSDESEKFSRMILEKGLEHTLTEIKSLVDTQIIPETKPKLVRRKNIKDEVIENYIIKKGLDNTLFKKIKMYTCLKLLGPKNLVFKDGEIQSININGQTY